MSSNAYFYATLENSHLGTIAIIASNDGLVAVDYCIEDLKQWLETQSANFQIEIIEDATGLQLILNTLIAYLAGENIDFSRSCSRLLLCHTFSKISFRSTPKNSLWSQKNIRRCC